MNSKTIFGAALAGVLLLAGASAALAASKHSGARAGVGLFCLELGEEGTASSRDICLDGDAGAACGIEGRCVESDSAGGGSLSLSDVSGEPSRPYKNPIDNL